MTRYVYSNWGKQYRWKIESCTGKIIKFGSAAVCTVSRPQKAVALSSTEAKYNALADCATTTVWLGKVLKELNVIQQITTLMQDNSRTMEGQTADRRDALRAANTSTSN